MKILAFFDRDNGRDVELSLPVLYMAERYYGATVDFAFSYDTDAIRRHRPDLVFVPNTVGSNEYIAAAKYAFDNGIKVFALMSEGDIRTDGTFQYWGLNHERIFYQEKVCIWSDRVRDFLETVEPSSAHKFVVTGHTGFDRYRVYQFPSKAEALTKEQQAYRMVVGYAGWGFGKMSYEQGRAEIMAFFKGDTAKLDHMERMRQQVEQILRHAIESNPDVLFILKQHPNESPPTGTAPVVNEIISLKHYPNVRYEGVDTPITTLIHISDLWLSFESTTAVESWALDKTSILLYPDPTFSPNIRNKGLDEAQLTVSNSSELQAYIDEWKKSGRLAGFHDEAKQARRADIIRNTVGFDDGRNHVRAGIELGTVLKTIRPGGTPRLPIVPWFVLLWILIRLGRLFYIPKVYSIFKKTRKFRWVFEQYDLKNVHTLRHRYYTYLDAFHESHRISETLTHAQS
jgi:surface carbohydrate biosynthesis protein